MKSWKTTVAGLLAGGGLGLDAVLQAFAAGAFTGKTGAQLAAGIGLIFLGAYAKDHDVTGGTKAQ